MLLRTQSENPSRGYSQRVSVVGRQLERVIRLAQSRLLEQHWHAPRYTTCPQPRRRVCQRIGHPLAALIHQSREHWGRLNGNLPANSGEKMAHPRAKRKGYVTPGTLESDISSWPRDSASHARTRAYARHSGYHDQDILPSKIESINRKRDCGELTEVQVDGLVVFCAVNTRTDRLLQRESPRVERGVGASCS